MTQGQLADWQRKQALQTRGRTQVKETKETKQNTTLEDCDTQFAATPSVSPRVILIAIAIAFTIIVLSYGRLFFK